MTIRLRSGDQPGGGLPASAAFLLTFIGLQVLVLVYGGIGCEPYWKGTVFGWRTYLTFWYGYQRAPGWIPCIQVVNVLALLYLWARFRRYRPHVTFESLPRYLYYAGAAFLLLSLEYTYTVLPMPPAFRLLPWPMP